MVGNRIDRPEIDVGASDRPCPVAGSADAIEQGLSCWSGFKAAGGARREYEAAPRPFLATAGATFATAISGLRARPDRVLRAHPSNRGPTLSPVPGGDDVEPTTAAWSVRRENLDQSVVGASCQPCRLGFCSKRFCHRGSSSSQVLRFLIVINS